LYQKLLQLKTYKIVSGIEAKLVLLRLELRLLAFLIFKFKNLRIVRDNWRNIQKTIQQFTIDQRFQRLVKHEEKYFFNCNMPGWPQTNFFDKLLAISDPQLKNDLSALGIVQIGFTKKCPLNCEHCYEGKILNQPETISLSDHIAIVKKLQDNQISMIQFGGGEPLNRFDDLISVLKSANDTSDFWIYSSGYGLTEERARELKSAGLTGVSISLDHFEPDLHNIFRRNQKSFEWAINAIQNAQKANLLTAMSICVTNEFCSEENLFQYLYFAARQKVAFVQMLEPRATGNYEGKDVLLTNDNQKILELFHEKINSKKEFKNLPILQYTGYQQRKKGCAGAGNRYIYIDTDGYVQSCPFCRNKKSHFLSGDIKRDLSELKMEGCDYIKNENKESSYA
jgi:MoaA/NifB/PqqE/SkfB family radical SAM enzyme